MLQTSYAGKNRPLPGVRCPPAQLHIEPEIPSRYDDDGDGVGDIAVHAEKIELQIQEHRIEHQTCEANQLKLGKSAQPILGAGLPGGDISERPRIIPDEIVDDRHFGGYQLASRKTPPEHRWVTQKK